MIRILYRTADGQLRTDLTLEELPSAFADTKGLLWVDFEGELPEVCQPLLTDIFGFHPLAVDDALVETHVPKVDDWGTYLYVALHAVHIDLKNGTPLNTHELDFFLGEHYLVSHHDEPVAAVSRVWDRCQRDERHVESDADHLTYLIADELAAGYMHVFEEMDDALDRLEDEIFEGARRGTMERIFVLKRAILNLRRVLAPQREVLNRLARDDYAVIDPRDRVYFRDVYDHMVRIDNTLDALRETIGAVRDAHLAMVNNRLSDIMRTLTGVATIMLPLTLVTGVFGMNFEFMPVVKSQAGFWFTMSGMLVLAICMLTLFRRRHWL